MFRKCCWLVLVERVLVPVGFFISKISSKFLGYTGKIVNYYIFYFRTTTVYVSKATGNSRILSYYNNLIIKFFKFLIRVQVSCKWFCSSA